MKVQNLARKAAALLSMVALVVVPVIGLAGCGGPSDEELIKSALTANLDAVKNLDADTVKETMGSSWDELESYGIDPSEFFQNCIKRFSYDNVSVTVDGDTAKATLDVTNVDVKSVMTTWVSDVTTYMTSQEALDDYNSLGEDGLMQKLLQQLVDALGADDAPTTSATVSIDFEKGDDGWEVADESQLSSLVFAGADLSALDNL